MDKIFRYDLTSQTPRSDYTSFYFIYVRDNYVATVLVNWKIWTIPQIINFNLVPVEYRVLFGNLVALIWNYYLARTKKGK